MKLSTIPCWWCSRFLNMRGDRVLVREIVVGSTTYQVHYSCAEQAVKFLTHVTASPPPDMRKDGLTPRRPACP